MSFDLIVEFTSLPYDLKSTWESAFKREGFQVEICPGFQPSTWEGGFLPMKVIAAPRELIGMPLAGVAVGGFELSFRDNDSGEDDDPKSAERAASFRFGAGGPTTEFAMLCVGAALLAELSQGTYVDPQSGAEHVGHACIDAAKSTIRQFLADAGESQLVHHPFPGWTELGA